MQSFGNAAEAVQWLRQRVTDDNGLLLDAYDDLAIQDNDLDKLEKYLELRQVALIHAWLTAAPARTAIRNYHLTLR